jgi:hypothetical protein
MNQIGVCGTGCRRQARIKGESLVDGVTAEMVS